MRTFALQVRDEHWWTLNDYGAVIDGMARLVASGRPIARVLEFGPGHSTRALIEGGAKHVDSCEDNPEWAKVHEERLAGVFPTEAFPTTVTIHRYTWCDPLSIPSIDGQTYDLGFIDGPHGTDSRPPVLAYAMARCAAVLMPTEDRNPRLKAAILRDAADRGWDVEVAQTGELSGGFALVTKPAADPAPEAVTLSGAAVLASDLATPEHGLAQDLVAPSVPALSKRAQKRAKRQAEG